MARIKKITGWMSVLAGSLLALYVGLWVMIIKPLARLYVAYKSGQVSVLLVVVTVIKCWLSLTVAGLIWSIGYMIKCKLD